MNTVVLTNTQVDQQFFRLHEQDDEPVIKYHNSINDLQPDSMVSMNDNSDMISYQAAIKQLVVKNNDGEILPFYNLITSDDNRSVKFLYDQVMNQIKLSYGLFVNHF